MSLKEYKRKRNFDDTPEPEGQHHQPRDHLTFVVHQHAASRLHFDLRLEMGGSYKSWAVPKGVTHNPTEQRLAVFVEDHPLEYGRFEGVIPQGNYGAGTVMIWDWGIYEDRKDPDHSETALLKGLSEGKISFVLKGHRLRGEFILVRTQKSNQWILMKKRDAFAAYSEKLHETSVATGRTMEEIANQAAGQGEVWSPHQGPLSPGALKDFRRENLDFESSSEQTFEAYPGMDRSLELAPYEIDEAPEEKISAFIPLMEPVIVPKPFDCPQWLFSWTFGGVRALLVKSKSGARLFSKSGRNISQNHPEVISRAKSIPEDYILDGEIFYQSSEGHFSRRAQDNYQLCFSIWDMLSLRGKNLRPLRLSTRLDALRQCGLVLDLRFQLVEMTPNEGMTVTSVVTPPNGVGILGRDETSSYKAGVCESWQLTEVNAKETRAKITHPDKILFPELGLTKQNVVDFYNLVAPYILPHLKDRPQSMNRHPSGIYGENFYHKDVTGYVPSFVSRVMVDSPSSRKSIHYLMCQNLDSLIYMVNMGCIEFHPFFSRRQSLSRPDYCVIDLDPDGHEYSIVVKVAQTVLDILDSLRIPSWVKTSGARGMHIMIPLKDASFDDSLNLAVMVCLLVEEKMPELTTTQRSKSLRNGRLYLDAYQNRRSSTIASVYSLRPVPDATVSTPIHRDELTAELKPQKFTVNSFVRRLDSVGDLTENLPNEIEISNQLVELESMTSHLRKNRN